MTVHSETNSMEKSVRAPVENGGEAVIDLHQRAGECHRGQESCEM
jgi:hypothetical protein